MPSILQYVLCAVIGYFLGNFSTGMVVSKLQNGVDIRQHGSGNAGATNMLRVLGRRSALFTILGDALKGWIAVGIGWLIGGFNGAMVAGTGAILGHIWPVFFGFKGGKGVATTLGVGLLLFPWQAVICVVVFLAVYLLTRYVSLGSILALLFCPILVIPSHWGNVVVCLLSLCWFLLILYAHRANVRRLLAGTENRIEASHFRKK